MKDTLSARGRSMVKDLSPLMQAHYSTKEDAYCPQLNPSGHINMGTAENYLVNEEIISSLHSIMKSMEIMPDYLHYDYFHGSVGFRKAIAAYWQGLIFGENSAREITKDNIVTAAGCSVALEMIANMLGDAGDAVLVPAPYYSGFEDDFTHRAGVEIISVHCGSELSLTAFEKALAEQKAVGKRICAVLFSSPNNPVGTVYSEKAIKGLIGFCMDNNLDIVSDEIYAQTIHSPEAKWKSTLSLVPDEWLCRTHVTSSFAKDFALSGFRTGFIISFNTNIIKGAQGQAYYSYVSNITQAILTQVLKSPKTGFIIQKGCTRLRAAYKLMVNNLKDLGIEVLPAEGGIFLFANFSPYMENDTFEAEYSLWEKIYKDFKINISPGQLFGASSPGWFRVCFAHEEEVVTEACRRLKKLGKK